MKVKQSALAYKQDPDKQERHDGNDDDEDELGMIEILIRIILFPFVCLFLWRTFTSSRERDARGSRVGCFGYMDDSGSDTSSEADILSAYENRKSFC